MEGLEENQLYFGEQKRVMRMLFILPEIAEWMDNKVVNILLTLLFVSQSFCTSKDFLDKLFI